MNKLLLALVILIPQFMYNPAFAAEGWRDLTQIATETEQPGCGPVDEVASGLAKQYHEYPAFVGAGGANGRIAMTIFLNPQTGTFTLLAIKETGLACEVLDGTRWHALPAHKHTEDEDGDPS